MSKFPFSLKSKPHNIAPEDKVPVVQKLAYGLGTTLDMWGNWLYPGLVWVVFNMYLGVPPWLVSSALMINRLFDAVSDPFFGWLSDNTRSRWGRRRPYILVGAALAGVFLPCLVWVSPGWGSMTILGTEIPNYFWYMVASSSLYITIVSCFNVPWQSLGYELTPDINERTSVFTIKTAVQKIPEFGLFLAGAFATSKVWSGATAENALDRLALMGERSVEWFRDMAVSIGNLDGSAVYANATNLLGWATPIEGVDAPVNNLLGAQVYTIILGSLMVVVGIVVFFVVKERYYASIVVERKQERIKMSETIWQVLKCKPFRANLSMAFAYAMGTAMVGTLGFYATVYYVCGGDATVGSIWNTFMGLSNSLLGLLGVAFFAFFAKRLGKRPTMAMVQAGAIMVFISTWWLYTPEVIWLQVLASGLIAFTGAGFWMLYGSINADILDYDELENGKRREGAFTACGNWIMKVGQAVGIGASGFVLSATGFDATLGPDQTPDAIFNIRLYLALIPVIGLVVALVMLSLFTLSRERTLEIRAELEERRGKV